MWRHLLANSVVEDEIIFQSLINNSQAGGFVEWNLVNIDIHYMYIYSVRVMVQAPELHSVYFLLGFVWKADANCRIRSCCSSLSPWCLVATASPWGLRGHRWWGHIPMSLLWEMADVNPLIAGQHKHTRTHTSGISKPTGWEKRTFIEESEISPLSPIHL